MLYLFFVLLTSIMIYNLYSTLLKHLPNYTYIYPCFIFKNKSRYNTPIKIGMIFDITYLRLVFKLSKKSKFTWDRIFAEGLINLFSELEKYNNQIFFTRTHSKILKKLKAKEQNGEIEILSCGNSKKRTLWHTLRPPFEKTIFYDITFKTKSIYKGNVK